jgi:hypothetical protein
VAARTIEEGASAPNDGRPSVLSPDEQLQVLEGFAGGYYIQLHSLGRASRANSLIPGPADATSLRSWSTRTIWSECGWWAKPRREIATGSRSSATCATGSACGFRTCISTTTRTTWRRANAATPRAGRSTTPRCDAHVPGPRHIPLVTTSIPLACARGRRTGIGNEFGRAPDVPNLFVSDGSVMNTEAAANAALTVVAPGRPHRGAADGERSPRTGGARWFAGAEE